MYILYADDSGNTGTDYENEDQPIFSLAGMIIHDVDWHRINRDFQAYKAPFFSGCAADEVHAADIFSGKKERKRTHHPG